MFYFTKRVDEKQCTIGEVVMVISDFTRIPAGTKGVITEIYEKGVMVTWVGIEQSNVSKFNTVETIGDHIRHGNIFPAAQGWLSDGFSRDELEYLAFATVKHPKVDPRVYSVVNY
jgi:hypothetical protein